MIEFKVDGIDIFNPLKDKMPAIIEYLVDYYGEKYRKTITDRVNDARFIFLPREYQYSTSNLIIDYYEDKLRDISKQCWKESVSSMGVKASEGLLNLCSFIPLDLITDIKQDFLAGDYLKDRKILDIYKLFGFKFDDFAEYEDVKSMFDNKKNYQKCLECFDKVIETWEKYKEEYRQISLEFKENAKRIKEIEGEKINYHDLRLKMIGKMFKRHLALHNINFCERMFESSEELCETIDDYLCGNQIRNPFEIYQFIKLFKAMGFDYGKNLEDYVKAPKVKAFFESKQLKKDYKNIETEIGKVRAERNFFYNEVIKDLQTDDKIHGINSFASSMYSFIYYGSANGYVNIAKTDKAIKTYCVLPQYLMLDNLVCVHELGHIIETSFINDEGAKKIKIGFTCTENKFKEHTENYNIDKVLVGEDTFSLDYQSYELFNEVVNDYFSKEIANIMNRDGFYIGNCEDCNSLYNKAFVLMEGFIKENKQDLIECKMSTNEKLAEEKFGAENLRKLANAVNQFLKNRPIDVRNIIKSIIEKTGVNGVDIHDAVKMNCEWNESEQEIVDIFKQVEETRAKIRERKAIECQSLQTEEDYEQASNV